MDALSELWDIHDRQEQEAWEWEQACEELARCCWDDWHKEFLEKMKKEGITDEEEIEEREEEEWEKFCDEQLHGNEDDYDDCDYYER